MPNPSRRDPGPPPAVDVLVIGAGMSGLAMGWRLKHDGVEDFAIVEKSDGVGGVWRDNAYPGAGCDVPSHLYSFSFFPKADWSRKYAPRDEILDYFEDAADRLGLRPHLHFGIAVERLAFDSDAGRWTVTLSAGRTIAARAVVSAVGQLSEPFTPDIPGLDRFEGPVMHSARWDRSLDLSGQRVAVIGNAASAIQLLPHVAAAAAHMTVFQRTPNWVIPKPDRAFTPLELWLFKHVPGWRRLYRRASFLMHEARFGAFRRGGPSAAFTRWRLRRHIRKAVPDPEMRAKLTPDYPPGCKRILLSNDYFETLARDNVSLVTDGVREITADGLVTGAGETMPADAIVLATGFVTTEFLPTLDVRGPAGETLRAHWGPSPRAYRGVAVSGFPNLFMLYGPNTNLGHNSIIFMVEPQVKYVARKIRRSTSGPRPRRPSTPRSRPNSTGPSGPATARAGTRPRTA